MVAMLLGEKQTLSLSNDARRVHTAMVTDPSVCPAFAGFAALLDAVS
jgi:hypothetical protein